MNFIRRFTSIDEYNTCGFTSEIMEKIASKYKFVLISDSDSCEDYLNKRFFQFMKLPVVPVVVSISKDYTNMAPRKSFIDAKDFSSAKDLVEYITFLNGHKGELVKLLIDQTRISFYCRGILQISEMENKVQSA